MEHRIKQVRKLLTEEKLDALFITSSINIRYLSGFSGFSKDEREGYGLLTGSSFYVFADPRLYEGARKNSSNTKVIEFSAGKKLMPQLQEIIDKEKLAIIGFEENLTVAEHKRFKKLERVKLKLTEEIVEFVRQIKDLQELTALQKACALTDDAFSHVLKTLKVSVTELEVAWEIEKHIREHGGELSFPTIVAFGENSAVPHHITGNQKLKTNDIILLDFGAAVDGYHADMTRTVFFGKADEKFKEMHETVQEAQQLPFELVKGASITPKQIDEISRNFITERGYPSVPHSVGHGVGLEVHELPHIHPAFDEEIEKNTPFTIEPGIYIPGFGGVRIEDTVFYDGSQIVQLTKSPKNLIELD
ncbi:MAG: M24 family metallopeptidase [Candidatus Levyibacteriota bacterium]